MLRRRKMEEICNKFANKIEINIKKVYFLYSGNKLNPQLTFSQIINDMDKNRKIISILVDEINSDNLNNNSNLIKSIFPICKKCKEKVAIEFDGYKINYSCKNGHSIT